MFVVILLSNLIGCQESGAKEYKAQSDFLTFSFVLVENKFLCSQPISHTVVIHYFKAKIVIIDIYTLWIVYVLELFI